MRQNSGNWKGIINLLPPTVEQLFPGKEQDDIDQNCYLCKINSGISFRKIFWDFLRDYDGDRAGRVKVSPVIQVPVPGSYSFCTPDQVPVASLTVTRRYPNF